MDGGSASKFTNFDALLFFTEGEDAARNGSGWSVMIHPFSVVTGRCRVYEGWLMHGSSGRINVQNEKRFCLISSFIRPVYAAWRVYAGYITRVSPISTLAMLIRGLWEGCEQFFLMIEHIFSLFLAKLRLFCGTILLPGLPVCILTNIV